MLKQPSFNRQNQNLQEKGEPIIYRLLHFILKMMNHVSNSVRPFSGDIDYID